VWLPLPGFPIPIPFTIYVSITLPLERVPDTRMCGRRGGRCAGMFELDGAAFTLCTRALLSFLICEGLL
jgi:hypothetical protein